MAYFCFLKEITEGIFLEIDFILELKPMGSYLYLLNANTMSSRQASGSGCVITHGWKRNMWWPYVIIKPQPSGTGISLLYLAKPCLTTFPNSLQQLINSSQLLQLIDLLLCWFSFLHHVKGNFFEKYPFRLSTNMWKRERQNGMWIRTSHLVSGFGWGER